MTLSSDDILRLINKGESLKLEFKSDSGPLSSAEMYDEVVALANHQGGILLIGVEDDGAVSGAQPRRGVPMEADKMRAAVFGNTVPALQVEVSTVDLGDARVVAIEVPCSGTIVSTTAGVCKRRALGGDGKPATIPFPPVEHLSRRVDVARLDFSASLVPGASFSDLDPVEFARVRDLIGRLGGDSALLELGDEDLAKAMRVVETCGDELVPNVAGLLLLGREDSLQRLIPGHEIRLQALGSDEGVLLNEVYRGPIPRVLDHIGTQFAARNQEREIPVGLLRLPIPEYSPEGFREALNNAVLHRDYARLGAVYVQLRPDELVVASPGGLPLGLTVDNLLVHEPSPRNPRLAEVFRRVGLVEQTGRGVDRIYLGQLRYGRPLPDYSMTDSEGVRVVLRGGDGSLEFTQLVFEESEGGQLGLDQLIALNILFHERRSDAVAIAPIMQKSATAARSVLEGLVERGLVEARGSRRSREYMLSATLYRRLHIESGYVRGRGFDRIQQEQMVLTYAREHGRISRSQAMELCGVTSSQAKRLLSRMVEDGALELRGVKRTAHYVIPE